MSTPAIPPVTILAAIDYSDAATLVVSHAVETARQNRAREIHFLNVRPATRDQSDDEGPREELEEWLAARLQGADGVPHTVKVVAHQAYGDPAHVIVDMASDLLATTVVVGTHGRQGVQRMLMGSVAEAVVRKAGCSVLVVRPSMHHKLTPSIEPPCPRCVEARVQSGGEALWCEQHSEKHGRRHTYYNTRLSTWVSHRITL
jgi:nucleotide-binding universal stress UspA family protein